MEANNKKEKPVTEKQNIKAPAMRVQSPAVPSKHGLESFIDQLDKLRTNEASINIWLNGAAADRKGVIDQILTDGIVIRYTEERQDEESRMMVINTYRAIVPFHAISSVITNEY